MLVNATLFHVWPFVRGRGRFSPGLGTALVLFYPLGIAKFARAGAEGRLGVGTALGALLVGAALMAFPILLIGLRGRPYVRQTP